MDLLLGFAFICGVIFAGVFVLSHLPSLFTKLFFHTTGRNRELAYRILGYIGCTVHELGHAFFCIVFFHPIVDIELFNPHAKDDELGHVEQLYAPFNWFHQLGNFFIGLGPIIFGPFLIALLMQVLLPDSFHRFLFIPYGLSNVWPCEYYEPGVYWLEEVGRFFASFFSFKNLIDFRFWTFLVLSVPIAIYMDLSREDRMTTIHGTIIMPFLFVAVCFVTFLLGIMNEMLVGLTFAVLMFLSLYVFCLVLDVLAILGSLLVNLVRELVYQLTFRASLSKI